MERCNIKKNNSKVIMLKKLDKYIITQFLSSFFIGTALFIVIAIIFDIKEKLEDFLGGEASLYMIVTDYYLSFIPYITMLLAPLFIYLAVVFTTSRLAMRTEIIAILNGGVSYYRFLRPFLLASTFLVIASYGIYHYILPIANKKRLDF
ncbi:MAG TPA: LptF/LptG family permease, partial [Bacteroidetes bacterium]|nr:LptF/LptG family permease [Bacteroidota bacterium]